MADLVALTEDNFQLEVLDSEIPVLVDFWAPWCGPCRMLAPLVHELAAEFPGQLKVAKLNVDEHVELAGLYGVMSIPTLLLFKSGQVAERLVGYMPKKDIRARLGEHI